MPEERNNWQILHLHLADGTVLTDAAWRATETGIECRIGSHFHSVTPQTHLSEDGSFLLLEWLAEIGEKHYGQTITLDGCLNCAHFEMSGMARGMGGGLRGTCVLHTEYADICYRCNDFLSLERLAPTWIPPIPVNVDAIESSFASYTEGKAPFAIYKHGTIVARNPFQPNGKELCDDLLTFTVCIAPSFTVREMDDNNYLVDFGGTVYAVVGRDEYLANKTIIQDGIDEGGRLPDELLLQLSDSPMDDRYIGLFARVRLYQDTNEPHIIRQSGKPTK